MSESPARGRARDVYARFYAKALWPAWEGLIRQRATVDHLAALEASQWWRAERLREHQLSELRKLLAYVAEHVPYYKDVFRAARFDWRSVRAPEDLDVLPLLTREVVRERYHDSRRPAASRQEPQEGDERLHGDAAEVRVLAGERVLEASRQAARLCLGRLSAGRPDALLLGERRRPAARRERRQDQVRPGAPARDLHRLDEARRERPPRGAGDPPEEKARGHRLLHAVDGALCPLHHRERAPRLGRHTGHLRRRGGAPRRPRGARGGVRAAGLRDLWLARDDAHGRRVRGPRRHAPLEENLLVQILRAGKR